MFYVGNILAATLSIGAVSEHETWEGAEVAALELVREQMKDENGDLLASYDETEIKSAIEQTGSYVSDDGDWAVNIFQVG